MTAWGNFDPAGDPHLIDAGDIAAFAEEQCYSVTPECIATAAADLSLTITQATMIARSQPPSPSNRRARWEKIAKAVSALSAMLDESTLSGLQTHYVFAPVDHKDDIFRSIGPIGLGNGGDPFDQERAAPHLTELLKGIEAAAAGGASLPCGAGGAPSNDAGQWLFAGLAGAFGRIAPDVNITGRERASSEAEGWQFAKVMLETAERRVGERYLRNLPEPERAKKIEADVGIGLLRDTLRLSRSTLADNMAAGAKLWRDTGGTLVFRSVVSRAGR